MNTYLSLTMSAILFVTQSVWISVGICADRPERKTSIISDLRLSLAHEWENQGKYYQQIQDTVGMDAADQELMATANKNFNLLQQNAVYQLNVLNVIDEVEAQTLIQTIHTLSPSESTLSMMSDKTKSNKQKLESALKKATYQNHELFIKKIQNRAHEVGYSKTFTEIADQMRNRSYYGAGLSTAQGIGGLLGYLLVLTGVIGMLISFSYYPPFNDFIVVFFGSVGVGMIGIYVMGASDFIQ